MAASVRVLMVLEGWYGGGTEAYVEGLGRHLSRMGRFKVMVVLLEGAEPGATEAIRQWADDVVVLERGLPDAFAALQRLIRDQRPQVCHLHLYTSLLPVTVLARCLGVSRVVTTLHVPLRQWSWRHRLMWRAAVALSHRLVGVSKDVVQSLGRPPHPPWAYVIPAALPRMSAADAARSAEAREAAGAGQAGRDVFIVCGAGRLARQKDWPTLLRAFAAFRAAVDGRARLVLFGDGPLREELRRYAATLSTTDAVELRGWVPRQTFISELQRVDLFVLPSRFEGLGLAAVEAMQHGVPTVTAEFGASLDFIEHGVTGHRFPQGDWSVLAELMRWHYHHPQAARCIGARGRRFVLERYSEENTFGLYRAVYTDGLL